MADIERGQWSLTVESGSDMMRVWTDTGGERLINWKGRHVIYDDLRNVIKHIGYDNRTPAKFSKAAMKYLDEWAPPQAPAPGLGEAALDEKVYSWLRPTGNSVPFSEMEGKARAEGLAPKAVQAALWRLKEKHRAYEPLWNKWANTEGLEYDPKTGGFRVLEEPAKVPETPMREPVQAVEMRLKPPQMPREPPIREEVREPAIEAEESLGPLEAPVKERRGVPLIQLPPSAEAAPEISAERAGREMDRGVIRLTPQDIRQGAIEYNPMATFYASIWSEGGQENLNKALKLQEEIKRLKAEGLGPRLDEYVRSGLNDAQAVEAVKKYHGR